MLLEGSRFVLISIWFSKGSNLGYYVPFNSQGHIGPGPERGLVGIEPELYLRLGHQGP